jgi:hypothetical protein
MDMNNVALAGLDVHALKPDCQRAGEFALLDSDHQPPPRRVDCDSR